MELYLVRSGLNGVVVGGILFFGQGKILRVLFIRRQAGVGGYGDGGWMGGGFMGSLFFVLLLIGAARLYVRPKKLVFL